VVDDTAATAVYHDSIGNNGQVNIGEAHKSYKVRVETNAEGVGNEYFISSVSVKAAACTCPQYHHFEGSDCVADTCGSEIFSSTNLGSVGTNNITKCGSSGSICGEFDSNGDWDWVAKGTSRATKWREEGYYALSSAKYTTSDEVIGRVFVDAHGGGGWENDDFCSIHFKACSTASCSGVGEGGMTGGSWTQVSRHKDLHASNNGWIYKANHDNHNGVFSESNENSFSSHSAQQTFTMPANKNYVTMKLRCLTDQRHEEFKATKLVIENGMGCYRLFRTRTTQRPHRRLSKGCVICAMSGPVGPIWHDIPTTKWLH
jgi:hypothetical protein